MPRILTNNQEGKHEKQSFYLFFIFIIYYMAFREGCKVVWLIFKTLKKNYFHFWRWIWHFKFWSSLGYFGPYLFVTQKKGSRVELSNYKNISDEALKWLSVGNSGILSVYHLSMVSILHAYIVYTDVRLGKNTKKNNILFFSISTLPDFLPSFLNSWQHCSLSEKIKILQKLTCLVRYIFTKFS